MLRLVEPARSFAAEWAYEPPVESIEPLFFKLRRFAERIALELRGAGFVAEKLSLTLLLEDGTDHRREFRLPEPGANVEGWLRVLSSHLDDGAHRCADRGRAACRGPGAPAREAGGPLRRRPAGPGRVLGEPGARRRDRGRRPGRGRPSPLDTHRPDAFVMERPAEAVAPPESAPVHPACGPTLRRFRPPWPVRVACEGGLPARLEGGGWRAGCARRSARGSPRATGGGPRRGRSRPGRSSSPAGGVYQLARSQAGWCVEGMLD